MIVPPGVKYENRVGTVWAAVEWDQTLKADEDGQLPLFLTAKDALDSELGHMAIQVEIRWRESCQQGQ
jgi:hypothetical protein